MKQVLLVIFLISLFVALLSLAAWLTANYPITPDAC